MSFKNIDSVGKDDSIDPRDIRYRVDELETARDEYVIGFIEDYDVHCNQDDPLLSEVELQEMGKNAWGEAKPDEAQELKDLTEVLSDINLNEPLILEWTFEYYVRNSVDFIDGCLDNLPAYIRNNIDWRGVAEDWKKDYNNVTIGGVDYLQRS